MYKATHMNSRNSPKPSVSENSDGMSIDLR